jgi:hypothetical protein
MAADRRSYRALRLEAVVPRLASAFVHVLGAGAMTPSKPKLARWLGVERTIVEAAIEELCRTGVLVRVRVRGRAPAVAEGAAFEALRAELADAGAGDRQQLEAWRATGALPAVDMVGVMDAVHEAILSTLDGGIAFWSSTELAERLGVRDDIADEVILRLRETGWLDDGYRVDAATLAQARLAQQLAVAEPHRSWLVPLAGPVRAVEVMLARGRRYVVAMTDDGVAVGRADARGDLCWRCAVDARTVTREDRIAVAGVYPPAILTAIERWNDAPDLATPPEVGDDHGTGLVAVSPWARGVARVVVMRGHGHAHLQLRAGGGIEVISTAPRGAVARDRLTRALAEQAVEIANAMRTHHVRVIADAFRPLAGALDV